MYMIYCNDFLSCKGYLVYLYDAYSNRHSKGILLLAMALKLVL